MEYVPLVFVVRSKTNRLLYHRTQLGFVEIKCQLDATDDFYCRSYCLLNMFRAPLRPSSGAREYYTGSCCLWYLVLWFASCRYGVELMVVSGHITLSSTPYRQLENQSTNYHGQQPPV